jgi:hypothetical protein
LRERPAVAVLGECHRLERRPPLGAVVLAVELPAAGRVVQHRDLRADQRISRLLRVQLVGQRAEQLAAVRHEMEDLGASQELAAIVAYTGVKNAAKRGLGRSRWR